MSPSPAARSWVRLALLCAVLDASEFLLVRGVDPAGRATLAPQASAIFPFGVFHDLRWISVSHDSWLTFLAEVAGMLVVRGGLSALSVGLAWPETSPRPPATRLLVRGIVSTGLTAALLVPSVSLLFGLAVVPVSWLFLAAVPAALLLALILHPVGVARGWWRRSVPLRALGWVGLSFLVLSAAGAAMAVGPVWTGVAVAVASGLFDAWAWTGMVHAVVDRRPGRVVPVVPVALVSLVAVVVVGTVVGFTHARTHERPRVVVPSPPRGGQPVLVVNGYGSTFDGTMATLIPGPFTERQFSYRGSAPGGAPLPYDAADTVKPIAELDRMLVQQVEAFARSSGRPVDVVAESEGSLIAKTALLARPGIPVASLVMASPLLEPGRVTYPRPGAAGWGVATRELMTLVSRAFQSVAPIDLSPDSSFLRSLDTQGPVLRTAMSCPLPGVRQLEVLPLADATVTPVELSAGIPTVVVSAFHGGLLGKAGVGRIVAAFLEHGTVPPAGLLAGVHYAIRLASAAWQVPDVRSAPSPAGCAAAGAELARRAGHR